MKTPTPLRVQAICDHLRSLGAYTQATEIMLLSKERDMLVRAFTVANAAFRRVIDEMERT